MQQSITIAIANQKGGVGKTTTAINIATAIAAIGKKVLLIDLDPQGNASTGLGIETKSRKVTIYDVLVNDIDVYQAITKTIVPKLDVLSSTVDLAAAEIELHNIVNKETQLKQKLDPLTLEYDFIIIDCPPSLGLLTINALCFATNLVIPLQCEFFALEGLVHLINTTNLIKKSLNPQLHIEGILLTMMDRRNRLAVQVEQDVRSTFEDLVYQTIIPRNIKLSEAPSHGKPALIYDNKCLGSHAYMMLAKEMLTKFEILNDNEEQDVSRKKSVG
jgi:chromosome partitioning protein